MAPELEILNCQLYFRTASVKSGTGQGRAAEDIGEVDTIRGHARIAAVIPDRAKRATLIAGQAGVDFPDQVEGLSFRTFSDSQLEGRPNLDASSISNLSLPYCSLRRLLSGREGKSCSKTGSPAPHSCKEDCRTCHLSTLSDT